MPSGDVEVEFLAGQEGVVEDFGERATWISSRSLRTTSGSSESPWRCASAG